MRVSLPRVPTERIGEYFSPVSFVRSSLVLFGGLILAILAALIIIPTSTTQQEHPLTEIIAAEILLHVPTETEETKSDADEPSQHSVEDDHQEEKPSLNLVESPPDEDLNIGLYESSTYGEVPVIREKDKQTVYAAYQPSFKLLPTTKGLIAVVMLDFGLSDKISMTATEQLPPEVSFSASPYAQNLQEKIDGGRSKGHEFWLTLPIEGKTKIKTDAGPATLLAGLTKENNTNRTLQTLSKAKGYVGITFAVTPNFEENTAGFQDIIKHIAERGLGLAQVSPDDTQTKIEATALTMPFAQGNAYIDTAFDKSTLEATLANLEKIAMEHRFAVVYMKPYPALFSIIAEWQKTLATKNIQLAPLSAVINESHM